MGPVERSAIAKATTETIWNTCFEGMKWELWDPDVAELKDVKGGCEEGATFTFVMKNGMNIPATLSNVKKNQSVTFTAEGMMGMMRGIGTVNISPVEDGTNSRVDYTFEMGGMLGSTIDFINPKAAVEGTEHGLANIVNLSEEAQS